VSDLARLPASLIRKYGVSKKAWAVFRGRHRKSGVKTMAKRRSYRPWRRLRRRGKRDRRMSIIGTAGAIGSIFVPRDSGHMSLGQWILRFARGEETDLGAKADYILSDTIAQYIGYNFKDGTWGIPMATVVLAGSGFAASVAGKFGNKYISRVPYVGNYIKM